MHKIQNIELEIQILFFLLTVEEDQECITLQKDIEVLKNQLRILKQETFN